MGAYCHFVLLCERALLETKMGPLAKVLDQNGIPMAAGDALLEEYHVAKLWDNAIIGDFGRLADFTPFFHYGRRPTTKKPGITEMLAQAIDASTGDPDALPFAWMAGSDEMKVQGFEQFLFNYFTKEIDGISFPQDNLPEFVEVPHEQVPAFLKGCKRIVADLKDGRNPRQGAPDRDPNAETLRAMLNDLKGAPRQFEGDLLKISTMLQRFVNQVALYDMNHTIFPEILESIIKLLGELDIHAKVPEDPWECADIISNSFHSPRKPVWDVGVVEAFCQGVEQILQPYATITSNKDLLKSWNAPPKGLKKQAKMGKDGPKRDVILEDLLTFIESIRTQALANPRDMTSISGRIQGFMNNVAAHTFNNSITPEVLDNLAAILGAHEIPARIPEDWREYSKLNMDAAREPRMLVWSAEMVDTFCTDVKRMIQKLPTITINKELLEYGASHETNELEFFLSLMDGIIADLEEGIKRGFTDYLCIISH